MSILFVNIQNLIQVWEKDLKFRAGKEMLQLPEEKNAFLFIKDGVIADFGPMESMAPSLYKRAGETRDLSGRMVYPAWCDSHTHIVYAGSREQEYIDKVRGLSYEEIARRGGGILNSVQRLRETEEDRLYEESAQRVVEVMRLGTGALEIKSGYGLDTENELKMLRVIRRLSEDYPVRIRSTFLGAHAFPPEFRNNRDQYVDQIIREMIPEVGRQKLADYIDVFCDRGFFTPEQTERILEAGARVGLIPKIHANELDFSGGIQTGVKHNALSVDHLEFTGEEEINLLRNSGTMPTLLPGASFFLELDYAPARKMIDSGLPVALASDYNPGSTPSGNMNFIMSLGLIKLKMMPEEVINAVTLNSAYAMGLDGQAGVIRKGNPASFIISRRGINKAFHLYAYGSNHIEEVWLKGEKYV